MHTSLDIAHHIKRDHKKVMRDIDTIISAMQAGGYDGQEWFEKTTYQKRGSNQCFPLYLIAAEGLYHYYLRIKAAQSIE